MRKILLWISIGLIIVIILFVGDVINTVSRKVYPAYGSIILLDSRGMLLTEKGRSGGYMLPYSGSLERDIVREIIQIEDNRFYEHHGIDVYAKVASIWQNIQAGGIIRGGSTITEQYIKNTYYPGSARTIKQKLREGVASIYTELVRSKEEILRGYLDSIYFGNNTYGLGGLERSHYRGRELSEDDMLDIITLINTPNIREEKRNMILAYREKVRRKLGIGTENTGLFEKRGNISLDRYPLVTERILESIGRYCKGDKAELLKWTKKIYSDICFTPLVNMELSLDGNLMEYSQRALESILAPLTEKNVTNGAIYIYNPKLKKIIAYIANRQSSDRGDTDIDMIQKRRSVGSILKPFIYLLALNIGHDPNDFILDDTRVYPTGYDNKGFVPFNYVEKSYGPVRMREALGNSLNASTVRLSEELGIGKIYDFFRENGLSLDHDVGYYGYGIALGGVELSLENIVEAYGNLIGTNKPNLYLLEDMLKDPTNRARTFGISSILGSSVPLAVKTGTSTDFRDNWTVSYNKDTIIGVWVGNSDASPMEDVSGVSGAGPLWHAVAEYMISRGMIQEEESTPPLPLEKREFCLDRSCFQKEYRLSKKKESTKSRPLNNMYFESDFITRMTKEEKEKWDIRE